MRTFACVLVLCLVAPNLIAHGGQYKGPTNKTAPGGGPPNMMGGGAGNQAGGSSNSAPGSGAGLGSGSGGARARGGSGRSGSAGGAASISAGLERWEFWWQSRRDRFLHQRLERVRYVPGSARFLTGRGVRSAKLAEDLSAERIAEELVPALLKLTENAKDSDILDSSLVALARSASPSERPAVQAALERLLPHSQRTVSAASALSLGILGGDEAREVLIPLLLDDSTGRQTMGGHSVDWFVRSFAALGLGLIGDDAARDALLDLLRRLPDSERDIKASVIAALGLHPAKDRMLYRTLGELRPMLYSDELDPVLRSYVPTTLAKACGRLALGDLTKLLLTNDTPHAVTQSTVIALGLVARLEDVEVADALREILVSHRDEPTRHFALIALAEIGARDTELRAGSEAHTKLQRLLAREITGKGRDRGHRSWGALAAASYAGAHDSAREPLIEELRTAFMKESDPSFRGAQALALGMLGDTAFGPTILAALEESQQDEFLGHAAIALGLLHYTPGYTRLAQLCSDPRLQPDARLHVSMGLGLLAPDDVLTVLLENLGNAHSLDLLEGTANSLGLVGDGRVLAQLIEFANDEQRPSLPRAFACVALGLLGERSELPFHVSLREHNNYGAQVPAIAEMLRIL